jgi:hypothetical protein
LGEADAARASELLRRLGQRPELAEGKPETFDFLGFTHFCTRSRKWGTFVTPVFATGSCMDLRNATLIALSLARMRFLIVLRPMTNDPYLRDRVQKCG